MWCYLPDEAYDKKKKNFVSSEAVVDKKTAVGQECIVGAQTEIGAMCAVRSSIIGKDCKIAAQCKITNTVLMDDVTLEEGYVLFCFALFFVFSISLILLS